MDGVWWIFDFNFELAFVLGPKAEKEIQYYMFTVWIYYMHIVYTRKSPEMSYISILVGALRDVIHGYLVKLLAGTGKVCLVQVNFVLGFG